MAMSNASARFISKISTGNKVGFLLTRSFVSGNQLFAAKNSQNKGKGRPKKNGVKEEETAAIPQSQDEYDKFISTYKNDEFFKYNDYSYYDIENELLSHRQPQPKKPALH